MAKKSREERRREREFRKAKKNNFGIVPDETLLIADTPEDIRFQEDIFRTVGPTAQRIKKSIQRAKWARRLLAISGILALFLGTTLLYTSITASRDRQAAEVPAFHTRYEALGAQIVTSYLQELPPPNVMLSSDVRWPGNRSVSVAESNPDTLQSQAVVGNSVPSISGVTLDWGERYPLPLDRRSQIPDIPTPSGISMVEAYTGETFEEVLRYYVVMNGQPVMMSINLLTPPKTDYTTVPVLLSTPTVSEIPRTTQLGQSVGVKNSPGGRDGYFTFKSTAGLEDTLSRFAIAWAKNDQGTLKLLTRDSSAKQYAGLGGWSSNGDIRVLWGAQTSEMRSKDQAYIQASFTVEQTVLEEDEDDRSKTNESTYRVTQTMDFLVGAASTDSPSVLAWGIAGTWPDLKEGGNALPENSDAQSPGEDVGGSNSSSSELGGSSSSLDSGSSSSSDSSSGSSSDDFGSSSSSSREDSFDAPPIDDDYETDGNSSSGSSSSMSTEEQCRQLGIC